MNNGIGNSVMQDLSELGISAVKGTGQMMKDVVKGGVETLTGAGNANSSGQTGDKTANKDGGAKTDQMKLEKKQKDASRMKEVKAEIEEYQRRKRQLDARIAQDRMKEDEMKKQNQMQEKAEKDNWLAGFMRRVGAQSHGESAKHKD